MDRGRLKSMRVRNCRRCEAWSKHGANSMKCGHTRCRQNGEIYNLSNERWECEVHHRTIRSQAASRQTRIDIRARRERQRAERNESVDAIDDEWVALLERFNADLDE